MLDVDIFYKNQTVMILGGYGFLGKTICEILKKETEAKVIQVGHTTGNIKVELTNKNITNMLFQDYRPDYVINCAGLSGNIKVHTDNPVEILTINTQIGDNVFAACNNYRVKKLVSIVTSCAYDCTKQICKEDEFLSGKPHETVFAHGYAKRHLFLLTKAYYQEYGFKSICICPDGLYGVGEEINERTKFLGSLIKRFCDAINNKEEKVVVWGSGLPLREVINVQDAARQILRSLFLFNDYKLPLLNIGTNQERTITQYISLIKELSGFNGSVEYDKSKPDGQMRKSLDRNRQKQFLGEFPVISLESGIKETIEWYQKERISFNSIEITIDPSIYTEFDRRNRINEKIRNLNK